MAPVRLDGSVNSMSVEHAVRSAAKNRYIVGVCFILLVCAKCGFSDLCKNTYIFIWYAPNVALVIRAKIQIYYEKKGGRGEKVKGGVVYDNLYVLCV